MNRRIIFSVCAISAFSLLAATNIAAQGEQKSANELIAGNWTLMIADNVRSDGNKVPGFGPLPKGTAKFELMGTTRCRSRRIPAVKPRSAPPAHIRWTILARR
jgi:hypothetical protein